MRVLVMICTLACLFTFLPSLVSSATELEVTFDGQQVAQRVELQHESEPMVIDLSMDSDGKRFASKVNTSYATSTLVQPFDLVIGWQNSNEIIFLNIGPHSPQVLRLSIDALSNPSSFKPSDLNLIDNLGSDDRSMLQKYMRARRFHKYWRDRGIAGNEISLRSARIWFDASVNLVKRRPYIFRPDREIAQILEDYRTRAEVDSGLKERVRKYFPAALIWNANAEATAAPYKLVADIPTLIKERRFEEAHEYNDIALRSFEASSSEERRAITAKQGVNLALLRNNSAYIESLMEN